MYLCLGIISYRIRFVVHTYMLMQNKRQHIYRYAIAISHNASIPPLRIYKAYKFYVLGLRYDVVVVCMPIEIRMSMS